MPADGAAKPSRYAQVLTPPEWAEAMLRLALKKSDREPVSGDLLEEYRDAIVQSLGRRAADAWYVRQVAGFVWRATWVWALLLSGSFVFRTAYDWLVPTTDFHVRAEWSSVVSVSSMVTLQFSATANTKSVWPPEIATCCLPLARNDIGPDRIAPPV